MPDDDTHDFTMRMPKSEHTALQTVAKRSDRSIAAQARHYVREGLRRDGALPAEPPPENGR